MLGRVRAFGQGLVRNAALAFSRFPVPTLLVLVFALLSNFVVAEVWMAESMERVLAALSLAAFAAVAATLLAEAQHFGPPTRHLISLLAAICVGCVVFWVEPFGYRVTGLSVATMLAVPLLPFWGRGQPTAFWNFGLWTLVALGVAFASTLVFLVGLYAVVEMARTLLDIALFREADPYVLATGLTLVAPLVALGRIPQISEALEGVPAEDRLARAIRPLFDWVLAPLVWLSALVLYLYLARLALEGGLASADARWSLGIFCTLAFLLRIGADPFLADGPVLSRLFGRFWFALLALPVLALGFSQWQASEAIGLTLADYYVRLWTVSLWLVLLAQLLPRFRGDITWMVGLQALAFLLSSVGPWGVVECVTRSQLAAFHELPADGLQTADAQTRAQLRQRLRILEDVGGLSELRPLLPAAAGDDPVWASDPVSAAQVESLLGLEDAPPATPSFGTFNTPAPQIVSTLGYDLAALDIRLGPGYRSSDRLEFVLEPDHRWLSIGVDGQTDRLDLESLVGHLAEIGETAAEPLIWDARTQNGRHVRFWVKEASFEREGGQLVAFAGAAFLRSEEWRAVSPPN